MLSLRLTQKLEGLSDETLAHFEAQADLLLTLPAYCRAGVFRRPLHLVDHPPGAADSPREIVAASLVASKTARLTEQRQLTAEARTWLTRSRCLLATLQATTTAKPHPPAKVDRRRLAIVRRARSG